MAITVCFSGVAGASPSPATVVHVKPGGVWTLVIVGIGCQVLTFDKGHTFTASDFDNAGTYTGGGRIIHEKWNAGSDAGLTFKGTYSIPKETYSGPLGGIVRGAHQTATLMAGAMDACGG